MVDFVDAEPARRLEPITVAQPHRDKGEHAAAALLKLLAGGRPAPATTLPTELVIRGSTAKPTAE